jgi:hypothetical protein
MHLVIESPRGRSNRSKAGLLLGSALFVASVAGAWADAVEVLQGAWVSESSDCTKVFEKVQGQVQFKDRTYVQDNGFIIAGSKAKGPIGGSSCKISQVDEENDRFSALLSCSDAVVSRNFSWSFRLIDATHFERLDPKFPEFPTRYKKCEF